MAYKDILVVADTAKSAASRYDVAAALARAHGANVTALFVKTPPGLRRTKSTCRRMWSRHGRKTSCASRRRRR